MRYLNTSHLQKIKVNWKALIDVIEQASTVYEKEDYHQPIKSYLRYRDPKNRIISMPAYIGGEIDVSGIKWIASFPDNIKEQIPRAHSVTILNETSNGVPNCIINSPMISGLRTAAVSGLVLRKLLEARPDWNELKVGVLGMGPIGRLHLEMVHDLFDDKVVSYHYYDINSEQETGLGDEISSKLIKEDHWEPIVSSCDVVIPCTVASEPYIKNIKPASGSLHLNVSLRDYESAFMEHVGLMLVDNWEEVCRENTNIEHMHKERGLSKKDTYSMAEMVQDQFFDSIKEDTVTMFNPMGMAIFDVAVGKLYYQEAVANEMGVVLD